MYRMQKFYLFIGIVAMTLMYRVSANLPAEIQKCQAEDGQCIARATNQILRLYPKGNPLFGLPAVDELKLENVKISQSAPGTPVQLDLMLKTMNIYGVEKTQITHVEGFNVDPLKSKILINATIPNLVVKGKYVIGGKILLLPLSGEGDAEIRINNLKAAFRVKLRTKETRGGKKFVTIEKVQTILEPDSLYVNLDNLYGNKDLSDNMNEMLRENWQSVWAEVGSGVNEAISSVAKNLMENVLQKLAYSDFFRIY